MWCQKRFTTKNLKVYFPDNKHRFYLENVCGEQIQSGTLCLKCSSLKIQTKNNDEKTFPHGLVTGPYTKDSHIFDSPWYSEKVKAYGTPSKDILDLAMEAQKKARAGKQVKGKQVKSKDDDPVVAHVDSAAPAVVIEPDVKEKKKRAPRKKKELPIVETDPKASILAQLGATTETIVTTISSEKMAESMDSPLEVKNVIRIVLKPFTHNDVKYWRDGSLEKLYNRKPDGTIGEYVGRWNSLNNTIVHDAPDSDLDDCV